MNPVQRTSIKTEDLEPTILHLRETLVESIDLTLQAKQAHWNVTGPRFRSMHLQLDDIVEHLRKYSDTVAERIVTLGEPATGLAAQVAHQSKVDPLPIAFLPDEELLELLVDRLSGLCARLRGRIAATADRDPVTADLFTRMLATFEEQMWMFHAQAQ